MTWAMLGATKRAEMARDWLGKVMGTFGPRRCAGGELGGGAVRWASGAVGGLRAQCHRPGFGVINFGPGLGK